MVVAAAPPVPRQFDLRAVAEDHLGDVSPRGGPTSELRDRGKAMLSHAGDAAEVLVLDPAPVAAGTAAVAVERRRRNLR
ncbi:hypothetical protein [Pseudonocardia cypriaca]|uniref:hypothetical protein n=1 Tax=Pseudonocardia cypriaca TaxID=882449 RepID=UPI00114EAC56|nr:hypothetical protein [Pseudonocardia cypriaca]